MFDVVCGLKSEVIVREIIFLVNQMTLDYFKLANSILDLRKFGTASIYYILLLKSP